MAKHALQTSGHPREVEGLGEQTPVGHLSAGLGTDEGIADYAPTTDLTGIALQVADVLDGDVCEVSSIRAATELAPVWLPGGRPDESEPVVARSFIEDVDAFETETSLSRFFEPLQHRVGGGRSRVALS